MLIRITTGFILAIITILACFTFPAYLFNALSGLFIMLAAIEWAGLINNSKSYKVIYIIGLVVLSYLAYMFHDITLFIAVIWWMTATGLLAMPMSKLSILKHPLVLTIIGYLLLVPAWIALIKLREANPLVTFTLIMFVCFADTGAYFIGSKFGKHKLAPVLSPKKTYEGFIGGLVIGLLAGLSMVVFFMHDVSYHDLLFWLLLGAVVIIVGMIGDLFESLIKRICQVKDSGNLLPGHGGVLDRVDSLLAALPIYAVLLHTDFLGISNFHL